MIILRVLKIFPRPFANAPDWHPTGSLDPVTLLNVVAGAQQLNVTLAGDERTVGRLAMTA
jgi:hypothetical protein